MSEKQQNGAPTIDSEKLDKISKTFTKLIEIYGNELNPEHIDEILSIICSIDSTFLRGTSQEGDFFTFADIERLMLEQNRLLHDANLRNLFQNMKRLSGEKELVLKKNSPFETKE
jgi:hypothetical protein